MRRLIALLVVVVFPVFASSAESPAGDGKYVLLARGDYKRLNPVMPKPVYPYEFRSQKYEAVMLLRIYLAPSGRIDDVKIRKWYGDGIIGPYAVRAAKEKFTFGPPTIHGRPAAVCFDLPIVFLLSPGRLSKLMIPGESPYAFVDRLAKQL